MARPTCAVADVKPSLQDRDDIAKRGHPVLQRSPIAAHSCRDDSGAHRLPVCPHVLRDKRLAAGADPAPVRHSLPRPSPTAPNEPSTIQRRPKAALSRRRLAERHVVDANWLETSPKPLKLSARHPGTLRRDVRLRRPCRPGPEAGEIVLRWVTREFSDRSRRACSRGHERQSGARSAIGRCPL